MPTPTTAGSHTNTDRRVGNHISATLLIAITAAVVCSGVGCHKRHSPIATTTVTKSAAVPPSALRPGEVLGLYQSRARSQLSTLAEYSDEITINAQASASSEKGQMSLTEKFSAPRTLAYTDVHFAGSGFIKTDVILRVLQADAEHVHRGMESKTAILDSNYKFSYSRAESHEGRTLYRFAVMPRRKSAELFKGAILLDPWTGHLVRALGRLSKSPSWWVKRVDFSEDYADFGDFTLPFQIASVTQARIVGRVVLTIRHSGYQTRSVDQVQAGQQQRLRTAALQFRDQK